MSNGFHSGLVVPRQALADVAARGGYTDLADLAARFAAYPWLELGWGEEEFYRSTRTIASIQVRLAFRALFLPNRTVVQVVGLSAPAQDIFPGEGLVRVALSQEGFGRLGARMSATFAPSPDGGVVDVGPGLYGPSRFYRAEGRTSALNVCNTWVGRLLNAAGLPNSPLASIVASGLLADLRLRSGLDVGRRP